MDKHLEYYLEYSECYLSWKRNDGLPVYLTTWMNLQMITLGEKKLNLGSIIWQCGKSLKPTQTGANESMGMGEVGSLKGLWGNPSGCEDICTLTSILVNNLECSSKIWELYAKGTDFTLCVYHATKSLTENQISRGLDLVL